jgi:hypothetical protein
MNELIAAPLTNYEMIITGIERAKAIEQSELMALENLRQSTGDYFTNSETSVRSIASHWSRFIKQDYISYCHPQQLEQAYSKFIEYLEGKKPYSENGNDDYQEPVRRYVSDKLLEIASKGDWLTSEKVKREVYSVRVIRDMTGKHAQLIGKMCKFFIGELKSGDVDLATLPERSVVDAFSSAGVILLETLTKSANLALEVNR